MKLLFTLTLLFCLMATAGAQSQVVITGRITDQQTGQGLPFASVALYRSTDSVLVSGTLADAGGSFRFEN
jgi:ferric enterobactin receptor